jgi:hypothetical protein
MGGDENKGQERSVEDFESHKAEIQDLAKTMDRHFALGMDRLEQPSYGAYSDGGSTWEDTVREAKEPIKLQQAELEIFKAIMHVGAGEPGEGNQIGERMLRTAMHERLRISSLKRACLWAANEGDLPERGDETDADVQARVGVINLIFQNVGKDKIDEQTGEVIHSGRELTFDEFDALMNMQDLASLTGQVSKQIMVNAVRGLEQWEEIKLDLLFSEFHSSNNSTVQLVTELVSGVCSNSQSFMNSEIQTQFEAAQGQQKELRRDFEAAVDAIAYPLSQSNNYTEYDESGKAFTADLAQIVADARTRAAEAKQEADEALSESRKNVLETVDTNFDIAYARRGGETETYLDVGQTDSESLLKLVDDIKTDYSLSEPRKGERPDGDKS